MLAALAQSSLKSFQLLIAGRGDKTYIDELKDHINKLQLQNRCRFICYADGDYKNEFLQAADPFTLTSYSENFGIAVLEELANGTPTLVTQGIALSK